MLMLLILIAMGLQSSDEETSFRAAQDFTRCWALYDSLADRLEASGMAANATEMRDTGRGAMLVAEFFSYEAGISPNLRDEFLQQTYESERSRQRAFSERQENDVELMDRCLELNPIQVEVIQLLRMEAYSQE